MNGYLLDTNIISELIRPRPDVRVTSWVDSVDEDLFFLSVLTLGEIRKGIAALASSSRRARLEDWLEHQLRPRFAGRVLPIDEAVADRWGEISGRLAARSQPPVPVIDGFLAATALWHDLVLVTRNTKDVAPTGVRVFNPWQKRPAGDASVG